MAGGNDLGVPIPIAILAEHGSGANGNNIVIVAIDGDISDSVIGVALDPVIAVLDVLVAVLGSLGVVVAAADILVLSNSISLQRVDLQVILLNTQQIDDLAVPLIGDDEVAGAVIDVGIGGLNEPLAIGLALIVRQNGIGLCDGLQLVILGVLALLGDFNVVAIRKGDGAQAQSHNKAENQSNDLFHVWFLQKIDLQKRAPRFYSRKYSIEFFAVNAFGGIVSNV